MAPSSSDVVVITGASSGIGAALAREYAARGARIALVARRKDRLEALAAELGEDRSIALAADVTKDGDVEAAIARTVDVFGRLDVVVANAGSGVMGAFERLTLDDFRQQVELNVFGVLRTVFASVPELRKTRGRIVVVSSVMAYLPLPGGSAYSMSKAAARSLAESLGVDLSPLGISVTHVAPGFIDTELRRVGADGQKDENAPDPVPQWLQMKAPVAARKIARATQRRRRELVLTGHGKVGVWLGRHLAGLTAAVLAFGARRAAKRRLLRAE